MFSNHTHTTTYFRLGSAGWKLLCVLIVIMMLLPTLLDVVEVAASDGWQEFAISGDLDAAH